MTRSVISGAFALLLAAAPASAAPPVVSNPGWCAQFYPNANCQNRRAKPARPSPRIDACVPHYNISGKTAAHVGGAALRTQQRGQGIPVGSNRSAVRHIHYATGSVATLVGRECPLIEVVG